MHVQSYLPLFLLHFISKHLFTSYEDSVVCIHMCIKGTDRKNQATTQVPAARGVG